MIHRLPRGPAGHPVRPGALALLALALVGALLTAWAGPAAAQQAPAAPTDLLGYRSAAGTVTLEWVDPEDTSITKYQVQYQRYDNGYNTWADLVGTGASSTSATVSSLNDRSDYTFRVRACAGSTCGGHAEEWLQMTPYQVTSARITSRPRAGDTYTVGETIEVTLAWNVRTATFLGSRTFNLAMSIGANERHLGHSGGRSARPPLRWRYTVTAADLDADGISVTRDLWGNSPGVAGGGLAQLVKNLGRHRIVNDANHKVNGALTAPAAPTGLTAAAGFGQVTLRWTDPQLSSLGAYQVRYAQASASYPATWTTISGSDATTTEHVVTSLTNETEYKFQIRARNGAGFSPAAEVRATPTATPLVSAVEFASTPASGDTYGAGEAVLVDVEFSAPITVTGTPRLALTVGTATRQAAMTSTAANSLRFRYIVAANDADTDGIGIAANALTLNGATIAGANGLSAGLALGSHAFAADAGHKVNGSSATVPSVSAVRITSNPVTGSDTYGGGERIAVEVEFAAAVPIAVTGSPRLAIAMDRATVRATLDSTDGQVLRFGHVVQTGDLDANGISISASALELNGGAIRSLVGTNANLGLGSHAISNASNHKVVGSSLTQPTVTAVSITSSPVSGDTYGAGEAIHVEATFSLPVTVTGAPQAVLTLGNVEVNAAYRTGSGSTTLAFRYVVRGEDTDADGLSILALALNSGTVRSSVGANASLSLSGRTITNDANHKVDGSTATVPTVSSVSITSAPASGDTYGAGETIRVRIGFTTPVLSPAGMPRVALAVGSRTRYAAYASGSGTSALVFTYTAAALDVDADGISIGPAALSLDGGTINSHAAANATLGLGAHAITNAANHKVDGRATRPTVTSVRVTSSPRAGDTYEAGETITVQVGFSVPVSVEGTPQLALVVGIHERPAAYASGDGATLTFNYRTKAEDLDPDGIGITANALALAGGRIRSASGTNAYLAFGRHAITAATGHKVNGARTVPTITGLTISSDAGSDNTYAGGDVIALQVTFSIPVTVTFTPQLPLLIGSGVGLADYATGSGTTTLTFHHRVRANDVDTDGISTGATAILLSGGTIRSGARTNANLTLGTHAFTNDASHKVDGRSTAPAVIGVTITSDPDTDDTYGAGDRIQVEVEFQLAATVTGTPRLALSIGSATRQADFHGGGGTRRLTFRYTVASTDRDNDGISIGATALALNSGTIRSATAVNATLGLGTHAISNDSGHKVNGTQAAPAPRSFTATPAGARQVQLNWANPGNSAITGYQFRYRVLPSGAFNAWTAVPSSTATTTSHIVPSLTGFNTTFRFELRAVVGAAAGAASVAEAIPAAGNVTNVQISSRPRNGISYATGETIEVTVTFSGNDLDVDGTAGSVPSITLNIGDNARSVNQAHRFDTSSYSWQFRYTVTAADSDADGISVGPNALVLGAGDYIISYQTSNIISPTIGRHQIINDQAHRVGSLGGASVPAAPTGLTATPGNREVSLTWTDPQNAQITSWEVRHAEANAPFPTVWTPISGSSATTTSHTVGSLTNGVEFKFEVRAQSAVGPSAASNTARATPVNLPTVTGVRFVSGPQSGDTYGAGEVIRVDVQFSDTIRVTGGPRLALTIGAVERKASMESVGTNFIRFRYMVQTADVDADGIGIAALALSLEGGSITNTSGTAARRDLGSHAWTANASHKVNGATATAPMVSGVKITSRPSSGGTYGAGERIEVEVQFGALVPIRVTGSPQLALTIGTRTRQAALSSVSGQSLRFRYSVQSADSDADGIGVGPLTLNGGSILSTAGAAANLSLGSHAITTASSHKVNGSTATPPRVIAVAFTSTPVSGDTYGAGERIGALVTFGIPIAVTGAPQLTLGIGSESRTAAYTRLDGQTLHFEYTVVAADADTDGVSIGGSALALNRGTILSTANAAATLSLGASAITNATAHKVNGANATAPTVSDVRITSTPQAGTDTYGGGETIEVAVEFDATVAIRVTGSPQLTLDVGGARTASLTRTVGQVLYFAYAVQRADVDANGIGIGANALTLNSGAILSVAGAAADLSLGSHAITNDVRHKVSGSAVANPTPQSVTIASTPKSGDTYGAGETISLQVAFQLPVTVTGTPQLALTIGASTVQANYVDGNGTRTLTFQYVVQSADSDPDGIGIGASALTLNSGTITSAINAPALLGLGANAIAGATSHKVDGSTATAPSVISAAIAGTPVSGDTYGAGERIEVAIGFDIPVQVTGAPQLALTVGASTVQAAYLGGSGTTLTFGYVVQSADRDSGGISVGASALTLNNGTITSTFGGVASLSLGSHAIADAGDHKVNGATATTPTVNAASITSTPVSGDTYGGGERITVEIGFTTPVRVTGAPQLTLTIVSGARQAAYATGSGTKTLAFSYTVQSADSDANGIGIGASALGLNSGTIRSTAAANATLDLGSHAITDASAHKVDGGTATAPSVNAATITSRPASGDTYGAGETISVAVGFNLPVTVTGAPQLALTIGRNAQQAAYATGDGTTSLTFRYTVLATDADTDGIGVGASALTLNNGTIQSSASANARLALGSHAIANAAPHKVDGAATVPAVTSVAITSSAGSDATYANGETISVEVGFQIPVTVTGDPQLALTIGQSTVQAALASGSTTQTLTFAYTVQLADRDSDGIDVGASALTLNSGAIRSAAGTNATLALGSNAIATAASHKVDGSLGAPGVTGLAIDSPAVGQTFERGETIEITVTFNKTVDVTGTPQLGLGIGRSTRQADYATGHGSAALVFRYTVAQSDVDNDGIGIAADALTLNSGTIDVSGGTTDAVLGLGAHAIANSPDHKVNGGNFTTPAVSDVAITSTAQSANTYELGERIEATVTFARPVTVTGAPQLALTIGTRTRQAAYVASASTATVLTFRYTVVAADSDSDGIGIGGSALTLASGTINDARDATVAAALALGTNAIANAVAHKVDGSQGPPGVTDLALNAPVASQTYERGETIEATVTFNKAVDVTGAPRLALTIGSSTRQADFATGSGSTSLVFRYTVVQADADTDGISIAGDALTLNSGAIDVADGATDAVLALGAHAIANSPNHKVDGATFTAAAVSDVAITSSPAEGDTYEAGETIEASVTFTHPVTVTGTPQLALGIGAATRQASYASITGGRTLTFQYTVAAMDRDTGGISIAAAALTLNSGAINDARDATVAASLGLGTHAIADSNNHKVDGTATAPAVTAVAISSSPAGTDTYGAGETIAVQVSFQIPVTVAGSPQLALGIGAGTAQAAYARGNGSKTLTFEYEVPATDADTDGISVAASALTLNDGTIRSAAGTDAALGLGANAITNSSGHKVDGAATVPAVTAVTITSSPTSGDTYGAGETIAVQVAFQIPVTVTGSPRLALAIGTGTGQASYARGGGSKTLTFEYEVGASDVDADGISVGGSALTLNNGTIRSAAGTNATLSLGAYAIANSTNHKVDGPATTPAVTSVTITSAPASGDTYGTGETIAVQVGFVIPVTVVGAPQLALGIGGGSVQAGYADGGGTQTLTFEYVVQTADVDANGISIAAAALTLNNGTIRSAAGTNAALALGSHAVADDGSHKVDGATATPPSVNVVEFASAPVSGDTYGAGERIEVRVGFNVAVEVTGSPRLALGIDANTRQAAYLSGGGSRALVFGYVVQSADADANGVSVGGSALTLNNGTLASPFGAAATLALGSHAVTDDGDHKVGGSTATTPSVSAVAITGAPVTGDTYGAGETITVQVGFTMPVTVTGMPQLALTIGGSTAQAGYASGSDSKNLTFSYVVLATDTDADGIDVGGSALTLNGGTIRSSAGANATLALSSHAIATAANHKVDGSATTPAVTSVAVTSSPAAGDTYGAGETIEVEVGFNIPVTVTGNPRLALTIGAATAQADYATGNGASALTFTYTVLATDADTDGIGVGTGALTLNGGTIRSGAGTNAALALSSHAITAAANHKVNGAMTVPAVNAVAISSTPAGTGTYGNGETISVQVGFRIPVTVTGTPRLALTVGSTSRAASFATGNGTRTLTFSYAVQPADADANGIGVGASALTLNGGTIQSAAGTNATLTLGANAITDDANHKVDGAQGPPGVTDLAIAAPEVGDTFERGETIEVTVTFNKAVAVTGTPRLALAIGLNTRQAEYADGAGTTSLIFRYTVVMQDADADGIGAGALTLNSGTIRTSGGTDNALLALGSHAVSDSANHKVAGGTFTAASVSDAAIASSPGAGDTYVLGERIEATVTFDRPVQVTGVPQLALTIGNDARPAAYATGSGGKTLSFAYTVVAGDADTNGISVGGSALALNSGAVNDARDDTTAAGLSLGANAIADAVSHKVDGSQGPPGVSGVAISSPEVGDTFERGETIEVTVTFNKAVDVTGVPRLALSIGLATRQAEYDTGNGSADLVFRYTVAQTDADTNGIGIGASALTLNNGTILVADGAANAVLGLGTHAIVDSTNHKVAGGTFTAAAVNGASIASTPASASTYVRGERIEVEVTFSRNVDVDVTGGTPQLALTIGAQPRQAAYDSGTGTKKLVFSYTVQTGDSDSDGIAVGANALALNGGEIDDARDATAAASLGLGAHAIAASASHKVDGSLGPPRVDSVAIGSPNMGDTFERGERIEVTVTFHRPVDVTGTPQLALTIGSATRQASYVPGASTATALVFRYTVISGDADRDGISIGTGALALNDGTIRVAGGSTDAVLALGENAIANSQGHKVVGAAVTVSPETSPSSRLRTGEDGAQATFTVQLATEPAGNVVLDVASSDTGEGTVDTDPVMNGAQDTLTFTASTWNSAQTVTVTGVDDATADGPRDYTVTLEVDQADTADANYDALSTVTVYLVNDDDDATPDVNGDGDVDYQDALLMYYTYTAPILADPQFGPELRRILFMNLRGSRSDDAAGYLAILTAAGDWEAAAAGDLNLDGDVDYKDALLMYYTYTAPILADPQFGPELRRILFMNLRGSRDDDTAGYLAILDAAKALVTDYGSGP